jgi:chorismate synthase
MGGNSFGKVFKITTFGESHGKAVGVIIDGCPAGIEISEADIQPELDRRRPGQSDLVTPRKESDQVEIFSGVFEGKTTGTPLMMMVKNKDSRSKDYSNIKESYRPSHADVTYDLKYGFRDYRGGGRSSARETVARVAAGAVAKKILKEKFGVDLYSYVQQIYDLKTEIDYKKVTHEMIAANDVRCPDPQIAEKMAALIKEIKGQGDTTGGVIKGVIRHVSPGLGEPVFEKFHAILGQAMLSINAVKGFEIGSGFEAVKMKGSEHNDPMRMDGEKIITKTNNAGGVLGGITNGEDIYFRVAFKPVATVMMKQETVNNSGEDSEIRAFGRHDACVLPRAVAIVDSMSALVTLDFYLQQRARQI